MRDEKLCCSREKNEERMMETYSTCSPSSSLTKIENKEKKNEISLLSW
jgi:hypothetical protein